MGYYCDKEDCKCQHYYNHVCYIEKCTYEEAREFECDSKPDIKKIHRDNDVHETNKINAQYETRRIDDFGRVAIPKIIRRNLNLQYGDEVEMCEVDGRIFIKKK